MQLKIIFVILVLFLLLFGCNKNQQNFDLNDEELIIEEVNRLESIPSNIKKISPSEDIYPPILHSLEFEEPIPLSSAINTAGAEDSPFIMPDGKTLYFFFTPDPSIPVEKQLLDGVTGIYVSKKVGEEWQEAKRVWLQEKGKLSMDGCQFVQGNKIWFCSAREGFTGINWFTAEKIGENWQSFNLENFDGLEEVGELHISSDGEELYFHSSKEGGKGGYDLWFSKKENDIWQFPENLSTLNTIENEGWPYLSQDGKELWFLRNLNGSPAIYRTKRIEGEWQEPELIVSQFAGEPTLDNEGNLYFVHHYYKDSVMLEADIYVAYKK